MKQSSLFGGKSVSLGVNDNLLLNKERKALAPSVRVGVEEIYNKASSVFVLIGELLPHIKHDLATSQEELSLYLDKIKKAGIVALDTETEGLNPRLDPIAGMSLYTGKDNPVYAPIGHHFYDHNLDAKWFVKSIAKLVNSGAVKVLMHNATFDMRVLFNYAQEWVWAYWDTSLAAHMLNENEPRGLKYQWNKYCMRNRYTGDSYNDLFDNRKYTTFDPTKVYIYATMDVVMTYDLYIFQWKYLNPEGELSAKHNLKEVYQMMVNLEMPIQKIFAPIEERGMNFDRELNLANRLKYEASIREMERPLQKRLQAIVDASSLDASQLSKLGRPISINSGTQLKIVLWDALGMSVDDKTAKKIIRHKMKASKKPDKKMSDFTERSVGKDAMGYFKKHYPQHAALIKEIESYKKLQKIYTTYVDGLSKEIDPYSGNIHGRWNTTGTKTGRMSSSGPNFQNMPGKNPDIRPQFLPTPGHILVSADYSKDCVL